MWAGPASTLSVTVTPGWAFRLAPVAPKGCYALAANATCAAGCSSARGDWSEVPRAVPGWCVMCTVYVLRTNYRAFLSTSETESNDTKYRLAGSARGASGWSGTTQARGPRSRRCMRNAWPWDVHLLQRNTIVAQTTSPCTYRYNAKKITRAKEISRILTFHFTQIL